MANNVGYLRAEEMLAFKVWLDIRGVGWNPGIGLWEVIRIAYGGHTCVVTRNKVEQYETPVELRTLLIEFREFVQRVADKSDMPAESETSEITDTDRLDFMLEKSRKLVYEVVGYSGRGTSWIDIYVEQGFMAARRFEAIRAEVENLSVDHTPEQKRAAIDLAIIEVRGESSE